MREGIGDFIGAGLLLALGIAFAVGSLQYGLFGAGGRIGPGFVPFVAGILMAFFGAMIGVETWRRQAQVSQEAAVKPVAEKAAVKGGSSRSVALVFGLTLVAIWLVPILGFLVSFGLLILVLVTLVERESLLLGLITSIGAAAVAWLVFVELLQVRLPQSILQPIIGS